MLAQSGPEDHSRRVEALVRRWLQERQALIVQMLAMGDERDSQPLPARVQAFCEVLMDYVSAGHFEIYDELLAEAESRGSRHLARGQSLLQQLQSSTDAAIRFNDIYEDPDDADLLDNLSHELSELGLALEDRFANEDHMIALLHERSGITAA
ncbi:MAG TPA: Rsd/AlgQ family anti-sigma factor [Moraxellaceae bacterium]